MNKLIVPGRVPIAEVFTLYQLTVISYQLLTWVTYQLVFLWLSPIVKWYRPRCVTEIN